MEKKSDVKEVYYNLKQRIFLACLTLIKFLHASRGFGKSHVIAPQALVYVNNLPGGAGLLTCKELKQAKAKTLPVIESAWKDMGMIPGVHYSRDKKRPDHFAKPIKEPESPDIIWFANGCYIEMVGSRQYDAARGGSYDFILGDEIAFFPEAFWDEVIVPSRRGNIGKFMILVKDFLELNGITLEHFNKYYPKYDIKYVIPNPFHHGVCLFTSPPEKAKGKWIYRFEELAISNPKEFYWLEASALDNIDAYGREALETNRKMMKKRKFDIELGGKRSLEAQIRWYFEFDEDKHTFLPNTFYTSINNKLIREGDANSLIDADRPLDLTFDFSGWFNGLLVIQDKSKVEYIHDFIYVKEDSNINYLVDDFCKKYEDHRFKFVRVYGDRTGHDKTPFGTTLYQAIKKRLALHGWRCEIKVKGNKKTDDHAVRHKNMNEVLAEDNGYLPVYRLHKNNCKDLVIAIKLVETKLDFKKDKSLENDKDYPQEHAPHGTDMFDYHVHQKYKRKFSSNRRSTTGPMEYHLG